MSPARAGTASATAETSSELGGALGIAISGSIGAAIYRSALPAAAPSGARETLGSALAAGEHGRRMAATARDPFTHALTVTASIDAALLLIMAAFALRPATPRRQTASVPAPETQALRSAVTAVC